MTDNRMMKIPSRRLTQRIRRCVRATLVAGVCAVALSMLMVIESPSYAQTFGQGIDKRSNDRGSPSQNGIDRGTLNKKTRQSARAQREHAMEEVKRRFPGARVLKLKPMGNSVFRARVLTPGGKVKVVNVRAAEF